MEVGGWGGGHGKLRVGQGLTPSLNPDPMGEFGFNVLSAYHSRCLRVLSLAAQWCSEWAWPPFRISEI